MAVTYDNTMKAARMTATRDAVADGSLEIGTAAMASTLATFPLSTTGGSVSNGVWTVKFDDANESASHTVTASATGTAAAARIKNSGGTSRITALTVGTSGSDINLDSTSITSGQSVTLTSGTITHA